MPFVTSTTGSLGAGRRNVPPESSTAEIKSYYVSNSGTDGASISGNVSAPCKTLNDAVSRIKDQNTIYFKYGSYEFDEQTISTTGLTLQAVNSGNVTFDGTREIYDLADTNVNNGNWQTHTTTIVTDNNTTISNKTIYKIKLQSNVEIWQLFHNRNEVINARWPSAQWSDESVYSFNNWGHGYYEYKNNGDITDNSENVIGNGTGSHYYYENGEIVDVAHGNINLYSFVTTQQGIDSNFTLANSLVNLNVGSFKSYTKVVNSQTLDNTNNVIRLSCAYIMNATESIIMEQRVATNHRPCTESFYKFKGKINMNPTYDSGYDETVVGTKDIFVDSSAGMNDLLDNLNEFYPLTKTNIEMIGHSPSNIPIYTFNYKTDLTIKYKGVMAQDLLEMGITEPVIMGDDGFYGVDYSKIDVDMEIIS